MDQSQTLFDQFSDQLFSSVVSSPALELDGFPGLIFGVAVILEIIAILKLNQDGANFKAVMKSMITLLIFMGVTLWVYGRISSAPTISSLTGVSVPNIAGVKNGPVREAHYILKYGFNKLADSITGTDGKDGRVNNTVGEVIRIESLAIVACDTQSKGSKEKCIKEFRGLTLELAEEKYKEYTQCKPKGMADIPDFECHSNRIFSMNWFVLMCITLMSYLRTILFTIVTMMYVMTVAMLFITYLMIFPAICWSGRRSQVIESTGVLLSSSLISFLMKLVSYLTGIVLLSTTMINTKDSTMLEMMFTNIFKALAILMALLMEIAVYFKTPKMAHQLFKMNLSTLLDIGESATDAVKIFGNMTGLTVGLATGVKTALGMGGKMSDMGGSSKGGDSSSKFSSGGGDGGGGGPMPRDPFSKSGGESSDSGSSSSSGPSSSGTRNQSSGSSTSSNSSSSSSSNSGSQNRQAGGSPESVVKDYSEFIQKDRPMWDRLKDKASNIKGRTVDTIRNSPNMAKSALDGAKAYAGFAMANPDVAGKQIAKGTLDATIKGAFAGGKGLASGVKTAMRGTAKGLDVFGHVANAVTPWMSAGMSLMAGDSSGAFRSLNEGISKTSKEIGTAREKGTDVIKNKMFADGINGDVQVEDDIFSNDEVYQSAKGERDRIHEQMETLNKELAGMDQDDENYASTQAKIKELEAEYEENNSKVENMENEYSKHKDDFVKAVSEDNVKVDSIYHFLDNKDKYKSDKIKQLFDEDNIDNAPQAIRRAILIRNTTISKAYEKINSDISRWGSITRMTAGFIEKNAHVIGAKEYAKIKGIGNKSIHPKYAKSKKR